MNAIPNQSHLILTKFQKKYPSTTILTQNVDGLHKLSGSTVSEMHGALRNVRCITCNTVTLRQDLQIQLSELNPLFNEWALKNQWKIHLDVAASLNPDGDVDLKWNYDDFIYPPCACGGILKPDVVFFGENMPDSTRDFGYSAIANSSCLVIIGSSLTVYSALRLLKKAQSARVPIYIVNNGPTRGDDLATAIIRKNCIDELADLQNLLD
jgi:NAD-dependent deacetylase sirtuin 4